MATHWQRLAGSLSLLLLALLAIVVLWGLVGGWLLVPQAGPLVWSGLGIVAFLGLQLLIFRLLNLRSRADEAPPPTSSDSSAAPTEAGARGEQASADADKDADWRAWRG